MKYLELLLLSLLGVGSALATGSGYDVNESSVVEDALLASSLELLLSVFLLSHLRGLVAYLASTRERSVYLTHIFALLLLVKYWPLKPY
jgi:hypothetical protein